MLLVSQMELSLQSAIMMFRTWLQHCCPRSVMTSLLSLSFSCFLVNFSPLPLLTQNLVYTLTLKYLAFGFAGITILFDVHIFNTFISSNWFNPYHQHEATKCHQYEEHVREIKHGSFSPLVFSALGGMSASTVVVYKRLAFLLSTKWKTPYSDVANSLVALSPWLFSPALCHHMHPELLFLLQSPFQRLCTTFSWPCAWGGMGWGSVSPFFLFYSSL